MKRLASTSKNKFNKYFTEHSTAFFASLSRFWCHPFAKLLTISVMGISLALPAILYLMLQNIQAFSGDWQDKAGISLYLKMNVSESEAQTLATQIANESGVVLAKYISPAQGLQDFEKNLGFADVVQHLHDNPLPGVILVRVDSSLQSTNEIESLLHKFQAYPQIDATQLDSAWIKRLYAFINLMKNFIWALSALLAIAALLVIGNTMRLAIQNRHQEIEVIKLIGGTHSFIRRPLLYTGIFYGLAGSIFALLLVEVLVLSLDSSVTELALLYNSSFELQGLGFLGTVSVLLAGMMIGLIGTWLTANSQLAGIEP